MIMLLAGLITITNLLSLTPTPLQLGWLASACPEEAFWYLMWKAITHYNQNEGPTKDIKVCEYGMPTGSLAKMACAYGAHARARIRNACTVAIVNSAGH
ncbi:hypothetical protein VNO80_10272 [Phaseolus coccineus]|uniref:Uncharacterized protein n=1 Tax=Phaseolus coccineus TaxID=3886 RepID=A0AAN9ND34_PHACN